MLLFKEKNGAAKKICQKNPVRAKLRAKFHAEF